MACVAMLSLYWEAVLKKRINVLYQSSNDYAFMAGVSFTSLLANASEQLEYYVYVLTSDMSKENRDKFDEAMHEYPQIDLTLTFISAEQCEKEVKSWNVFSHRGGMLLIINYLWEAYLKIIRMWIESFKLERTRL